MKNLLRFILPLAAMLLIACTPKASVQGTVKDAPGHNVEVRELNMNAWTVLDTIKTDASGAFRYSMPVEKGQPEFIYLFHDGTRIASLLLKSGDKVTVSADTLGNFTVEGSDDSAYLAENEKRFAAFASGMKALDEQGGMNSEMARLFIAHYRECVNFVLAHPGSLACVPVLYESLNEYSPVFNQLTDAIIFRKVCDSLTAVYPDSRYVKALQKETERRENLLSVQNRVNNAEEMDYPELSLPGIDGKEVSLSGLAAKAVIVHFWDPSDAEQKMFNMDALIPIYNDFHGRGFEVYAVSLDQDKTAWASAVRNQKLPWVNVCDTRGAQSPYVGAYGIGSLPMVWFIVDDTVDNTAKVHDAASLREYLRRKL